MITRLEGGEETSNIVKFELKHLNHQRMVLGRFWLER